uniref:MFS transporter n=1 Tax=uncultured Sphingomonas sp. TaxID=158754 RepID=UPI0035CAEA4D
MTQWAGREEWGAGWPAPFAALTGVACSASFSYASGMLMVPMTAELGWTRAEFSSGFTIMMVSGLFFMPLAGRLADRWGARRVVLLGVLPYTLWYLLLDFVGQAIWLWWLLCVGIAATTAALTPPVWISSVVAAFRRTRGLALALALSGIGLAMALWPSLAAFAVKALGWRKTIFVLALAAGALTLFAAFGLPRSVPHSHDQAVPDRREGRVSLGAVMRSRIFVCITLAGGLFSSVSFGMTLHFAAMLRAAGLSLTAAGGIAGLIGIFSIVGRLGTGLLLDRVPTRAFGSIAFLLPMVTAALLWRGGTGEAIVGAAVLGLAGGAELDIVAYLIAGRFPRERFAAIYATSTATFAVCASFGPLLAGALFDAEGSYDLYLFLIAPMVLAAAVLISLVAAPRPTWNRVETENAT